MVRSRLHRFCPSFPLHAEVFAYRPKQEVIQVCGFADPEMDLGEDAGASTSDKMLQAAQPALDRLKDPSTTREDARKVEEGERAHRTLLSDSLARSHNHVVG